MVYSIFGLWYFIGLLSIILLFANKKDTDITIADILVGLMVSCGGLLTLFAVLLSLINVNTVVIKRNKHK